MAENLEVELIYLYPKENSKFHKTDKFELVQDEENPIPILRRGQTFTMAIRFAGRGFNVANDEIKLIFNFGPNPSVIKGTQGVIKLTRKRSPIDKNSFWGANVLDQSDETLSLEVFAPPTAPVGIWKLLIETSVLNSTLEPARIEYENDIFLLFNPWNCHDLVYMPEERLLDEYVLTDVGKIWVGPWNSSKGREWVFGQFDACVLPAAILMFEKSKLPHASRNDPIKMTRMISKMVNSNDDDGILIGRWDGEYDDGTAPSAWTGSTEILDEYLNSETPVPYGQCWVFSGVCTTICRALGIPSRVVSNLVSAHDTNASLSIDKYYNINNEEIEEGDDSIWNYHVWNDVWMARPDLPAGYGGWQAIDATPQETSSGFFQCGPASLEAIRKGQVGFNYDVGFMIASVNADLMRWKEDPSTEFGFTRIYTNKYHVGRFILTKQPFLFDPNGNKDRQDITNQYKAKEGTDAERISLYNAIRGSEIAKQHYSLSKQEINDVEFDLVELDQIKIGEGFCMVVEFKNNSDEIRTIKHICSVFSVFYNGVRSKCIKKLEGEFKIKPKSVELIRMTVAAEEYLEKLVEYCNLKMYVVASVNETKQTWADEDDFQIIRPNIDIKIPTKIPVAKTTSITLSFVNPLKKILTNCKVKISGPTLVRNLVINYPNVNPKGKVKLNTTITPTTPGEQKIVATFSSKELLDITGSAKVEVVKE